MDRRSLADRLLATSLIWFFAIGLICLMLGLDQYREWGPFAFATLAASLIISVWSHISEKRRSEGWLLYRFTTWEKAGFMSTTVIAGTGTPWTVQSLTGLMMGPIILGYIVGIAALVMAWVSWDEYQERVVNDAINLRQGD